MTEISTSSSPTRAMILAAGKGLRMRPITDKTPKPLIKLNGRPLIEHALDGLKVAGISDVVVNTHYLGDKIERHLKTRLTPRVEFSPENELLETGGGVKKALPLLGQEPFFVVNGDAFWLDGPTNTLRRMVTEWDPSSMDVLLLLHSTVVAYGYDGRGDFICEPDGKLARRPEGEVSPWLFTGVQIINPEILEDAPTGAFSLNWAYDRALAAGRLYGVVHDGEWFHIGTPDGLSVAEDYLQVRFPETKHR